MIMAEMTMIQWCDHTFNPWIGCAKVSPGCANCYAEASTPSRAMGIKWGKGQPRQRTSASNWREPLKWNRDCGLTDGPRRRVFCASLADWLDDEVPIEWLADLLKLIHDTPNLDWLLLTKRPENFFGRLRGAWNATVCEFDSFDRWIVDWGKRGIAPDNVWIGTTTEDQERAEERIPEMLKIPARVRFLSVEPMLGPVDLTHWMIEGGGGGLDWVIVGGESGRNFRSCNMAWIRDVVEQCQSAGVACFVKQLGSFAWFDETRMKGMKFKHQKGGDVDEWPEDLRVREFPQVSREGAKEAKE